MNLNEILDMDGEQLSTLMKSIQKVKKLNDVYELIMYNYFLEYMPEDDPIVSSWKNDPDEVWDANAMLVRLTGKNKQLFRFITKYETENEEEALRTGER